MARFVLVHGAWHGAWCWRRVAPLIEAAGHEALAIDLPGHGDDPAPPGEVTLDDYRDRVLDALGPGPAILVGHSMGGVPISAAAEAEPGLVEGLIYVAAFLLRSGERLVDPAFADRDSLIQPHVRMSADRRSSTYDPDWVGPVFYPDCTAGDVAEAAALLSPQPAATGKTPIVLTPERFGRIPRLYVLCARDRAVTPGLQRRMAAGWPGTHVVEMDCAHSPFWNRPEALAGHVLAFAGRIARDGGAPQNPAR